MMDVLRAVRALDLPDWWIAAGFVRGKVWDELHGFHHRTKLNDVDVVYFDPANVDERCEEEVEEKLNALLPGVPWSVKNHARMHRRKGVPLYRSTTDAIARWVETPTCIGVRIEQDDSLVLTAPLGIADLVGLRLRPNPDCPNNPRAYLERIEEKKWNVHWPKLMIEYPQDT